MEELKMLLSMVRDLPTLTVWVLAGFLAYKLAIVGSIYGLIRFAIEKLYGWLTYQKVTRVEYMLQGKPINDETGAYINSQLARLQKTDSYWHASHANKLKEAIDLLEREGRL